MDSWYKWWRLTLSWLALLPGNYFRDPSFFPLSSTLFSPLLSSSLTASLLLSFLVLFLGTILSLGRGSSFYNRRGYHTFLVCMRDTLPDAMSSRPPSGGSLASAPPLAILRVVPTLWWSECEWSVMSGHRVGWTACPLAHFYSSPA